jgi:hypothetical protein
MISREYPMVSRELVTNREALSVALLLNLSLCSSNLSVLSLLPTGLVTAF